MTSKKRSGAYYSSVEGREKKKAYNSAREQRREAEPSVPAFQAASSTDVAPMNGKPASDSAMGSSPPPDAIDFKESVIEYTRLIMTHTEGRKVSRDEALATLRRVVRQRSLDST